jgi:hypothetical protein
MEMSGQLHDSATLPLGKEPGTYWRGGWEGPRAGLDVVERRKILLLPGIEPRASILTHTNRQKTLAPLIQATLALKLITIELRIELC